MLRALILLLFLACVTVIALPILVSSAYLDQRGTTIPGRVYSKREDASIRYSTWQRSCEMTVEYSPPDTASVAFLSVRLKPEKYDEFRKGQAVSLHYLPRKDLPDLPLANILNQIHALPTARLADQRAYSAWEVVFTRTTVIVCCILAGVVVVLYLWRRSGLPGFPWAVAACLLVGLTAVLISEFPTPEPAPSGEVGTASGKVKSIGRIDRLFSGSRTRGVIADQPVAVVGVEFVPAGSAQAVLGVDLIDAGSIPGLQQNTPVAIDYQIGSPRIARIRGATRSFVSRNLRGMAVDGVVCLVLLAGLFAASQFLGRAYDRLLGRRK
jgi:hypothetical protein